MCVEAMKLNVRFGSFATGSSQEQVEPCPLCPDSNQIPHLAEMTLWANGGRFEHPLAMSALPPIATIDIAPLLISVQTGSVEYRGIRYTVRVRIEREQWSVAIYPKGVEMPGKVITGPREKAEMLAHSSINTRRITKVPSKFNDNQHT